MADADDSPPAPAEIAGGCSLGCAAWFFCFCVLWPMVLILSHDYEGGPVPPVLLGVPAFFVGSILALVGVFSRTRRSRRLAIIALVLMWIPALAALLLLALGSLRGW